MTIWRRIIRPESEAAIKLVQAWRNTVCSEARRAGHRPQKPAVDKVGNGIQSPRQSASTKIASPTAIATPQTTPARQISVASAAARQSPKSRKSRSHPGGKFGPPLAHRLGDDIGGEKKDHHKPGKAI
jgi:hypothetical protein